MRKLKIVLCIIGFSTTVIAQVKEASVIQQKEQLSNPNSPLIDVCATEPLWDNFEDYSRFHKQWEPIGKELKSRRAPVEIQVVSHVFTKDDGSGSNLPTLQDLQDDIFYANVWYQQAGFNINLTLVSYGAINSTALYDITNKVNLPYTMIDNTYGVDNHINIYYGNTISHASSGNNLNYIFHNMRDAGWGWTVAHELGHKFGLSHTFEDFDGDENVTRDPNSSYYNCNTTVDYLCDTPADYGTNWCTSSEDGCDCGGDYDDPECTSPTASIYTSETDAEGKTYQPDLFNLMAYGCRPCAHLITQGQVDIMWNTLGELLKVGTLDNNSCETTAFLTGNLVFGERTETSNLIESKQNIITNQYVLLDGASFVELNEGFKAEPYNFNGQLHNPDVEIINDGCGGTIQKENGENNDYLNTSDIIKPNKN